MTLIDKKELNIVGTKETRKKTRATDKHATWCSGHKRLHGPAVFAKELGWIIANQPLHFWEWLRFEHLESSASNAKARSSSREVRRRVPTFSEALLGDLERLPKRAEASNSSRMPALPQPPRAPSPEHSPCLESCNLVLRHRTASTVL